MMNLGAASISDDDARANGWTITYDSFGTKLYVAPDGSTYNTETGDSVDTSESGGGSSWVGQVTDLVQKGLSIYQIQQQQKAFNSINQTRAQQGLTPLPWSDFQPTASVGLTTSPAVLYTLLGIAAILIVPALLKRR